MSVPEKYLNGAALGHHYALHALRERRAELAGEIIELERRVRVLRQSATHLDATLAMFKPGHDPATIRPKKPYGKAKLFGAGKLNQLILDRVGGDTSMGIAATEAELAERAATFLKAEMKRAKVTYEGMAERLKEHGLSETRDSVASKLKRGTFAATFLLACLAALELEGVKLEDL